MLYERSYGKLYGMYNRGLGAKSYGYRSAKLSPEVSIIHSLFGGFGRIWPVSVYPGGGSSGTEESGEETG